MREKRVYEVSFQEDIGGVAIIKEVERETERCKKRETAPGKLIPGQ